MEERAVGAEEAVLGQLRLAHPHADVEGLAAEGGVRVVAALHPALAAAQHGAQLTAVTSPQSRPT